MRKQNEIMPLLSLECHPARPQHSCNPVARGLGGTSQRSTAPPPTVLPRVSTKQSSSGAEVPLTSVLTVDSTHDCVAAASALSNSKHASSLALGADMALGADVVDTPLAVLRAVEAAWISQSRTSSRRTSSAHCSERVSEPSFDGRRMFLDAATIAFVASDSADALDSALLSRKPLEKVPELRDCPYVVVVMRTGILDEDDLAGEVHNPSVRRLSVSLPSKVPVTAAAGFRFPRNWSSLLKFPCCRLSTSVLL